MENSPQFIVCEKTGIWAAAIRWQQNARPLPLKQARSLIDARSLLLQSPSSVVAVEVTSANAEGALRLILEMRTISPSACAIALLTNEVLNLGGLFLESGASLAVMSPRRLERIVRLVERHIARQESPVLTTRERVWARLPWSRREGTVDSSEESLAE